MKVARSQHRHAHGGRSINSTTSTSSHGRSTEPGPTVPNRIGYLLARAGGRAVRDFNRALQPHGMRSRHYTVLAIAAASSGHSQRDLSNLLGLDPSAIVPIVDDLEHSGLVRREASMDDRRTRLVVATEAGRELLTATEPVARSVDDRLLVGLNDRERETLRQLLERILPD